MDYRNHLKELRKLYYRSNPEQRIHVARQRLDNPEHGPNLIVTYASAIEGILRSLVVWKDTTTNQPSQKTYDKYKYKDVPSLFTKYLKQTQASKESIVSEETYELVRFALKYRHLLVHECTYLGQDKYTELIEACEKFLHGICKYADLKY